MEQYTKKDCEHLRETLTEEFNNFKEDWVDKLLWVSPSRAKYLTGKGKGKRNNHHIIDNTHTLAHRSMVAGFLEGNTSSTRSWFKFAHPDPQLNKRESVKAWMQLLNDRCLALASSTNLYDALALGYHDWGIVDTTCLYIDELRNGPNFTILDPGTYRLMNDPFGTANVLVREFPMTIKNVVQKYGSKNSKGEWDWTNFSDRVKNLYIDGNYNVEILICEIVKENGDFNNMIPEGGNNRKWVCKTYECGGGQTVTPGNYSSSYNLDTQELESEKYLRIQYRIRKPFIAFRNQSGQNFAYGETGPTTMSLGTVKSLNKKALKKDIALDMMIEPPMQGPASLKKNYLSKVPGSYNSMTAMEMSQGGMKPTHQIPVAINGLNEDIGDLRSMVRKLYYEDLLLFLSQNPKTRTAEEVRAVMSEQQLVIGPTLQSLNYTLNTPLVDFLVDYVIFEDPYLPPPPPEIAGTSLRTVFISVFAQAQRAADLPSIDRYIAMITNVGQLNPSIWAKANLDVLADLYEDRLYLPVGLNREQSQVDARRAKNEADMRRQQQMTEMMPAVAKAQKDAAQAEQIRQTPVPQG